MEEEETIKVNIEFIVLCCLIILMIARYASFLKKKHRYEMLHRIDKQFQIFCVDLLDNKTFTSKL